MWEADTVGDVGDASRYIHLFKQRSADVLHNNGTQKLENHIINILS